MLIRYCPHPLGSPTSRSTRARIALATFLLVISSATPTLAIDRTVCASGCDFTRIADAVAAADPGDQIRIEVELPAVHTESGIVIDKNLTLIGETRDTTIIQAAATAAAATDRILTVRDGASVTIVDLTLRHGSASHGGAIVISGEPGLTTDLTAIGLGLVGNIASTAGGGLHATFDTTVRLFDSRIADNEAGVGGGLSSFGSDMSVRESLIFGNRASTSGAGVYQSNGDLTLWNVTLTDNDADVEAGGLHAPAGVPVLRHVTMVGNSAPTIGGMTFLAASVTNSVIANNVGGDCGRAITGANLHNWDSDGSCGVGVAGTGDPKLEPLRDNGGPTWTFAPEEESPLVDAGLQTHCGSIDQRRLGRGLGGDCDIGAYERYELKTCDSVNLAIPDDDPAGISRTVLLNTADGIIDRIIDVNVSVFALHGWVGDLTAELSHDGIAVPLIDRPGVPATGLGCNQDDILASFDSSAELPAEDECSTTGFAIGGRFQPNGAVDGFRRRAGNGDWTLTFIDNASGFAGDWLSWCVYVELFDGPPEEAMFADGFETGNVSSWTSSVP